MGVGKEENKHTEKIRKMRDNHKVLGKERQRVKEKI